MERTDREAWLERSIALYNAGDFETVSREVGAEIRMYRRSDAPETNETVTGQAEMEAMMKPQVFSGQRIEVLGVEHSESAMLVSTRFSAQGAGSGLPFEAEGWMVFLFGDEGVGSMEVHQEEGSARASFAG